MGCASEAYGRKLFLISLVLVVVRVRKFLFTSIKSPSEGSWKNLERWALFCR